MNGSGRLGDPADDPARGMALALLGFVGLSVGDGIIKSIAGEWPASAVAALRYSFGALGFGAILWWREGRAGFVCPKLGHQLARGFAVAFATLAFFLSIFLMPLAEATVILFTNPMLTALISAWLLKEAATRRTWIATIIAFVGVLLVLRPSVSALGWAAGLPLLAAFGMAFVMIFNRAVAGAGSILLMQFLIAAIAAPILVIAAAVGHLSGIAAFRIGMPDAGVVLRCAIVAAIASLSHMLVYMATMRASAAAVAPMVYVQLLVALAIGMAFFGDYPDLLSLAGSAVIIGAGLWLWSGSRAPRAARA